MPKSKRCATCKHRVARYKSQLPHREWCGVLKQSTKTPPRAWEACKGNLWKEPTPEGSAE